MRQKHSNFYSFISFFSKEGGGVNMNATVIVKRTEIRKLKRQKSKCMKLKTGNVKQLIDWLVGGGDPYARRAKGRGCFRNLPPETQHKWAHPLLPTRSYAPAMMSWR